MTTPGPTTTPKKKKPVLNTAASSRPKRHPKASESELKPTESEFETTEFDNYKPKYIIMSESIKKIPLPIKLSRAMTYPSGLSP